MTAKEMFEALGYEEVRRTEQPKEGFFYREKNCKDIKDIFNAKRILFFTDKVVRATKNITMEELKAINQQCKELGWLDESI